MDKLKETAKKHKVIKEQLNALGLELAQGKIYDLKGHSTFTPFNNEPVGEIIGDYDSFILYKNQQ